MLKSILLFSLWSVTFFQFAEANEVESRLYQIGEDFHAGKYESQGLKLSELPKEVQERLQQIALKESDVWVDTILEADFQLGLEDLRVDMIEAIVDGRGAAVAFRIKISQHAFFTGECLTNVEYPEFTNNQDRIDYLYQNECSDGRISSYILVSTDFKNHERDPNNYEEFDN